MTSRRRLAFLLPNMRGGGAERVALTLIDDFVAQGYDIDLLLMAAEGELMPLLPPEVRVIDLRAPRIRDVLSPLVRYLRSAQIDGLQVSMWPLTVIGVLAHRTARSTARLVLSEHISLSKQYGHFGWAWRMLLGTSIRATYPLADGRVAVSERAADDLAEVSGVDRSSITTIYNPIKPPAGLVGSRPAMRPTGGPARIVSVGSLKAQKNHALLIEAFALLRRKRPAQLTIIGEGELRGDLEALAARLAISEDVHMPGFFVDPWPFYRSADLFVLSSDYEGYGNVLVEAMYAGLPIVSTDCESGPREILDGGAYGKLVPCGDAATLAEAMATTLDEQVDVTALQQRAYALSGQGSSGAYLQLMTTR